MMINKNIVICVLMFVYEVNQIDVCFVNFQGYNVLYKVNGYILVVLNIVYENLLVNVKKMNE